METATCPICGQEIKCTQDGDLVILAAHRLPERPSIWCDGFSVQVPVEPPELEESESEPSPRQSSRPASGG